MECALRNRFSSTLIEKTNPLEGFRFITRANFHELLEDARQVVFVLEKNFRPILNFGDTLEGEDLDLPIFAGLSN